MSDDDIEFWLEMRDEGLGYPGWIDDEFPEDEEGWDDWNDVIDYGPDQEPVP